MHVAVWPALSIVPLHPPENVVVSEGYHGDGVAAGVCHVHKAVVWIEGNANWICSHGTGATTVFVAASITETVLPPNL